RPLRPGPYAAAARRAVAPRGTSQGCARPARGGPRSVRRPRGGAVGCPRGRGGRTQRPLPSAVRSRARSAHHPRAPGRQPAGAAVFVGAARRLAEHLPFLSGSQRMADALVLQLRRIGLPLLALLFFLFWTFVYLALWAIHPGDAFRGLGSDPRFADFFYYAVSTALISPPGDILAHSRGVRAATMIEMLTGFGVLTAYLSSFVDFGGGHGEGMPPGYDEQHGHSR